MYLSLGQVFLPFSSSVRSEGDLIRHNVLPIPATSGHHQEALSIPTTIVGLYRLLNCHSVNGRAGRRRKRKRSNGAFGGRRMRRNRWILRRDQTRPTLIAFFFLTIADDPPPNETAEFAKRAQVRQCDFSNWK